MKYILASIVLSLLVSSSLSAQDFLISEGGSNTLICSDGIVTMFDAGGDANYGPGESWTITFCPDGGNAVSFIIDTETNGDILDILPGDLLTVFDGEDTNSPILGTFNNTFVDSPVISLFATLDNPSGCLTFLFESSENSAGAAGFTSQIGCGNFWQPFDFTFTSAESELDEFGYIDICQGEEITITADGIFPYSDGTGYEQTNENCYYEWDLGDGTLLEGFGLTTVTNTYTEQFGYPVELFVTDTEGLRNRFELSVRVSTTPSFAGVISQFSDTICLGNTTTLVGSITGQDSTSFGVFPTQSSFIGGGFLAGQTFLPDGSGVSYQTTIVLDQFPVGTTVENPEDIIAVCATLEHSFLGDLTIELSCPDGTTIVLQEQAGGSCNLGEPWATGGVDGQSANTTPGVGYEYCWTADATQSLEDGCVDGIEFLNGDGPDTYTDSQVAPGDYSPGEPLSDLVGCPINGEWTITVTDNIGADNGYIFSWGIQFDPSIDPTVENYTPQLVDGFWVDNPTIVSNNDTSIIVLPETLGEHCYTFNVSDNFGCDYDTTVCLTVIPAPFISSISPGCLFSSDLEVNNSSLGGVWSATLPTDTTPNPFLPNGSGEVLVFAPGSYTFNYLDFFCQTDYEVEVYFPPAPIALIVPDSLTICYGFSDELSAAPQFDGLPVNYSWTYDSLGFQLLQGFGFEIDVDTPGMYTLAVTDEVCDLTVVDNIMVEAEICEIETFNVFTPNGDGSNDFFYVEAIDKFEDPVVFVYNRWGKLLYEKQDYQNNWDMDGLPDGTYYYVVQNPAKNETFKGHFTLMR